MVNFLNLIYLYYNTIRFLKFSQIFWRIRNKLWKPKPNFSPRSSRRKKLGDWIEPARRVQSLRPNNQFTFLNSTNTLDEVGWDGPDCSKLWRYNQHYFDDLNAVASNQRLDQHVLLIRDWLKNNGSVRGVGWEPYPTSLRIVNWIKWQLAGNPLSHEVLQSLAVQSRWLTKKLEWHILGNHLFANGKALIFSGLFYIGDEAESWLEAGCNIIFDQLDEQVLPDGGHFERSPMYHSLILEDILDIINLINVFPNCIEEEKVERLKLDARKMLAWLKDMSHPDNEISFFNDSAIGISPSPNEISNYAKRLKVELQHIPKKVDKALFINSYFDSGYFRLSAPNAVVLIDAAPIGPNYLPGHAHADTLCFEMSLFGHRVFVNGGTSQYEYGSIRAEERGTSSHNTVEVDGQNSSEVWSSFRVAKRAKPFGLKTCEKKDSIFLSCSHDGYFRLPGKLIHQRAFEIFEEKFIIRDKLNGKFEVAKAFFNIHPNVKIIQLDQSKFTLQIPFLNKRMNIFVLEGSASLNKSFYSAEFGSRVETTCLCVNFESESEICVEISWN